MPRLLYLSLVISAIRKQFETSMEVPYTPFWEFRHCFR